MGFTRLHVGVQTLDDPIRKKLGRREPARDVLRKLESAMNMGFVVSADIIYGLPFQGINSLIDTLSQLTGEGIHGFSLYHLNITHKNRKFFEKLNGFERDIINDYLLFHVADNYLLQKGYFKNHFVHYARREDKNLYYNHVCHDEDLLAFSPTADGIFYDYFYIHNPIEEYLSSGKKDHPFLLGGGHLPEHDLRLRPLKARLMCAYIPENSVKDFGAGDLIRRWEGNRLIRKITGGYTLTANGSWFINYMVEELLRHEL